MKSDLHIRWVAFLAFMVAISGACAPSPAVAPTSAPPIAVFTTPTTESAPSPTSAQTSAPTATIAASRPTSAPSPAAATQSTPTRAPTSVATIAAGNPSGSAANVYATSIRVSPAQPVAGADYATFYVTFNNTSGKTQSLKWIVKIWSPDNSVHAFGETAAQINDISTGISEIASAANWRTNPIVCTPLYARVYWINTDISADPTEFKKPDGSPGPLTNFQVCPGTPKP